MKFLSILIIAIAALSTSVSAEMTAREAGELLSKSAISVGKNGKSYCSAAKIGDATFLTAGHCAGLLSVARLEKGYAYQYIRSFTITVSKKNDNKRSEDWAIINTTTVNKDMDSLELGCDEELYLGMPVAYAGFPSGVNLALGLGRVISVNPVTNGGNADFVVDLHAAPGASGSPVISLDTGRIVGVLTEGVLSRFGAYAVGIESVKSLDFCEDLLKEKKEERLPAVRNSHPEANIYSPF